MVKKVVIQLEQDEYTALLDMSVNDLRNPSDELRHILRMEIVKRMSCINECADIKNPKESLQCV